MKSRCTERYEFASLIRSSQSRPSVEFAAAVNVMFGGHVPSPSSLRPSPMSILFYGSKVSYAEDTMDLAYLQVDGHQDQRGEDGTH